MVQCGVPTIIQEAPLSPSTNRWRMSCVYHLYTDDLLWRNFLSPQCRNCSRDPDHAHSLITRLRLCMADPCTKFEVSSVSRCREITHTQPFNGLLSGTTRVGRYQKKHSPTHTNAHTKAACFTAIPMLCHLYLVSLSAPYWPFSSLLTEVPPHFLSLQARSHFHATCCFSHNCCTTFLS